MLGWSIRGSARRSARKRALPSPGSMPGLMTLTATLRGTGVGSSPPCEKRRVRHQDFWVRLGKPASGLGAEAQFAAQPGPSVDPVPVRVAGGHAQDRGRRLARQTGEVAQLHELGLEEVV